MPKEELQLGQVLQAAGRYLAQGSCGGRREAEIYWMEVFDLTYTDLILGQDHVVQEEDLATYYQALDRVLNHEPLQYITQRAYFMGHDYWVTPDTLIPRPETEELLSYVPEELSFDQILDIGTGSGVLAIELARRYPRAQVTGSDLSRPALEVARSNGEHHQVDVEWVESDLLEALSHRSFDLIVSNPPYIALDELEVMDQSVKDYEPNLALYGGVDGLAIYQRLAEQLPQVIHDQTLILLEIGYRQGPAVQELFKQTFPQRPVTVLKDQQGRDRLIRIEGIPHAN